MFQLTYISTAKPGIGDADVEEILHVSRANNARDGITGLLVHDGVRFLQALEGDRQRVLDTYQRIKRDDRHRAAVMLSERDISERQFGDWAMAAEMSDSRPGAVSMPQIVDALVTAVRDPNVRALFSGFARLKRP